MMSLIAPSSHTVWVGSSVVVLVGMLHNFAAVRAPGALSGLTSIAIVELPWPTRPRSV
jgi:hypothetical protein